METTAETRRRFLLLHGVANRRPHGHWQWWLAEELRRRGEQVLYPQLPDPDHPDPDTWTDLLHAELDQLGDGERVVVAHSLGCALWLRSAPGLPAPLRVDRVLLVSPLGPQAFSVEIGNERFAPVDEPGAAADGPLAASARPPHVVASATDPYGPRDPAAWSADRGLTCDVLPDAGHVTPADGYGPWPGVLRWCLDGTTPVTPRDDPAPRPDRPRA